MLTSHSRLASTVAAITHLAVTPVMMCSPALEILCFTSTTPTSIACGGPGRCYRRTSVNSRAKLLLGRGLSSTCHLVRTLRLMTRLSSGMLQDRPGRSATCCQLFVVLSVTCTCESLIRCCGHTIDTFAYCLLAFRLCVITYNAQESRASSA